MRTFRTPLGGAVVEIVAPRIGELDLAAWRTAFPGSGIYGLDVESTFMDPRGPWGPDYVLRTVQFGTASTAYVLRMDDPDQRRAATELLSNPCAVFVSHTQIDPCAVFAVLGVDISARLVDTHWLAMMASPDDQKGQADLKGLATKHGMAELANADKILHRTFDLLYRKDHSVEGKRPIAEKELEEYGFGAVSLDSPVFLGYAGMDAIAVSRLAPVLAKATRAPKHLLENERWLSEQAIKIRQRGQRVDVPRLTELRESTRVVVDSACRRIADATGGLKPTQTARLIEYFAAHGADWSNHPKTKGGAPTMSKDNVLMLRTYDMDPDGKEVVEAFIDHQHVLDRLRRTDAISDAHVEGRVHATLLTVGTVTGRMSSSSPNMQNFSKRDRAMRGLFIPDNDDYVFISCDYSQVEMRVVAALSGEQSMIDTIMEGGNLHQLTADKLHITKAHAKTVNFLIGYGGQGARLAGQIGRPVQECQEIVNNYWIQYPAIAEYRNKLARLSEITLISGRRVPVGCDKWGRRRTHAVLNYMVQGSSREMLTGAWIAFADKHPDYADMVWFPIHDELVLQVPRHRIDEVRAELLDSMTFDFMGVPIASEADVLIDEHGVSRWMSGDSAREIAESTGDN